MHSLKSRWLMLLFGAALACGCGRSAPEPPAKGNGQPPRVAAEAEYKQNLADLFDAVSKGQASRVTKLLDAGVNVNDKDEKGETALMKAAAGGHTAMVELLLAKGALINEQDGAGETATHKAARAGQLAAVKILREVKDQDLSLKDKLGRTAWMAAALEGHHECMSWTYMYSVDYVGTDKEGRTALMYAAERGHLRVVEELRDGFHSKGEHFAKMVRVRTKDGKTARALAEEKGNAEIVKILKAAEGAK